MATSPNGGQHHPVDRNQELFQLQRQVGNRTVRRMIDQDGGGIVQRDMASFTEFAKFKLEEMKADDAEQEGPLEVEQATYEQKAEMARKCVDRLKMAVEGNYERMLQDEKGMAAIDVAGRVEKALKWAFSPAESYADEYIGTKYRPILLDLINREPGLYEKLGLLHAMEPWHARHIGLYLNIPKLEGFDYEMSMSGGGGGAGVEVGQYIIQITCLQDGDELWEQNYILHAAGVGASVIPVTVSHSSGEFESLVYWGPEDFAGEFRFGGFSIGWEVGYSLGVGTFKGSGGKGSLTIDMSGMNAMSANAGGAVYEGHLLPLMGGKAASGPRTVTMEDVPQVLVYKSLDTTFKMPFPENSDEAGELSETILEHLPALVKHGQFKIKITGRSSRVSDSNLELMRRRMANVKSLLESSADLEDDSFPPGTLTMKEAVAAGEPGAKDGDPPRDRVVEIEIRGKAPVEPQR